jgi:hypothetical protein
MSKVRIPLIFTFAGMFFVTVAIAQLVGLWRIQHIDAGRRRQVSEHQRHVAAYRRLSPFGEHRDENAALWYRLAFQHFKGIRVDDFVEVRRLVSDADSASEKMRGVFRQRCKEVEEVRVRNALMCTRCDWGLNYSLEPTQLFDNPRQAGIVGECL